MKKKFQRFPTEIEKFVESADPEGVKNRAPETTPVTETKATAKRRPRKEKDAPKHHLSTYIDDDVYQEFLLEMEREDRTPSALARKIIQDYFRRKK